jgi:DNA-binding response OmpR family regulator
MVAKKQTGAAKQKILVVEDTTSIAEVMKLKLDNSGFSATIATNGVEALKALSEDTYDLILLDLIMPKLDGFGVLEEMKKRKIHTPVIVTTNLGQPEDKARVKEFGVKDYLLKVDMPLSEMVEHVKRALVS